MESQAPGFLKFKVIGVPYAAVGVSALLGPLAYMTLRVGSANVSHVSAPYLTIRSSVSFLQ